MSKIFIAFTVLFLSGSNAAPLDWVVKTTSLFCGQTAPVFYGSGLVFQKEGRVFILSSEHVFLHGKNRICHDVQNPTLGKMSTVLQGIDWGRGLALLEINTDDLPVPLSSVPTWLSDVDDGHDRQPILVTGYPQQMAADVPALADTRGQVLTFNSLRHLIPLQKTMIELSGAHGEYGMSGAPVFSGAGGAEKFLGLLSHQVLRLNAGGPSSVGVQQPNSPVVDNHLLVIPAVDAIAWVERVLRNETAAATRVVSAQVRAQRSVELNGLVFSEENIEADAPHVFQSGDGVGIGGEGGGAVQTIRLNVTLLAPSAEIRALWPDRNRDDFFAKIKNRLLRNQGVVISRLVKKKISDTSALKGIAFNSLEEFFSALKDPELRPVALVSGGRADDPAHPARDRKIQALAQLGTKIKASLEYLKNLQNPAYDGDVEIKSAATSIELSAELLTTLDWPLVEAAQIESQLNDESFAAFWRWSYNHEFSATVDLRGQLLSAKDLLQDLLP